MAKIYDPRNEPQTYQERRLVLECIRDLRMSYYDGDLEITGQVPVPAPSSQKNCHRGLRSDAERQRDDRQRGERAIVEHRPHGVAQVLYELI